MSENELARTNGQNQEEIPFHLLEELLSMRVSKRIPWPEIVAYYYQQTGQLIQEETLHQIFDEMPSRFLLESGDLSYELLRRIDGIWESAETDQAGFASVYARFVEWRLLSDKLRADASQANGDKDSEDIPEESLQRLDRLKNHLTSLFFELSTNTKNSSDAGAVLDQLTVNVGGGSGQDGPMTMKMIQELVEKVGKTTEINLEAIHQRHKEEGRGFYRQMDQAYRDKLEDDEL